MKILLTGANGYIGMRLLPLLLDQGHEIICAVRDEKRLSVNVKTRARIKIVEIDFLEEPEPSKLPDDIDAAYYLIMGSFSQRSRIISKEELPEPTIMAALRTVILKLPLYKTSSTRLRDCKCLLKFSSFTIPLK